MCGPMTLGSRLLKGERREKAFGHRNPDPYSSSSLGNQAASNIRTLVPARPSPMENVPVSFGSSAQVIVSVRTSLRTLLKHLPQQYACSLVLQFLWFLCMSLPHKADLLGSLLGSTQLLTWKPPGNQPKEWRSGNRAGSEGETVQHQTIEKGRNWPF